jgi:hypothetical protein
MPKAMRKPILEASQVLAHFGCLVVASHVPQEIGNVQTIDDGQGQGHTVVITALSNVAEARSQALFAGWNWPPHYGLQNYYYRAMAE